MQDGTKETGMTRNQSFSRIAAALLALLLAVPAFAARGNADFRRFVALGDSFGAGVSSVGMNVRHQQNSWPAVIARQVGLDVACTNDGPRCFQIPYISEPGILPELELVSLSPLTLALKPGLGAPINSGLSRPYNNLSIDGAEVADLVNGPSGDGNEAINSIIVTRNLGTPVRQALQLGPTFIAIWVGGNDAFNAVQAGGDAARMTSVADFTRDYNALLDQLIAGAPGAGMIVGTLPSDVRLVPFVNAVPTILVDANRVPVRDPQGNFIPLFGELDGGQIGPLPPGSAILLPASSLVASGFGIPAALAPLLPRLPNVGKPLPGAAVLTPAEIAAINQRLAAYNAAITAAASSRNVAVADIDGLMRRFAAGTMAGPFRFDLSFLTGGVISLDGFHLTDIGYTLFANEYIRTINREYGKRIPVASIARFIEGGPAGVQPILGMTGLPTFSAEAVDAMLGEACGDPY